MTIYYISKNYITDDVVIGSSELHKLDIDFKGLLMNNINIVKILYKYVYNLK